MIWIYRLLFLPIFVLCIPYYLQRMLRRGGYKTDFSHRFGSIPKQSPTQGNSQRIWIQAVSVGEVNAIAPLVNRLLALPDMEIVITTTTSTAYTILHEQFKDKVHQIGLFPIDFWPFSSSAWRRIQPDLAILMESELWPEHIHQAKARQVPILLINARMSDRSFKRYKLLRGTTQRLIKKMDKVLAASDEDRERLIHLGLNKNQVITSGNIKFDVVIDPILSTEQREALKADLGLQSAFKDANSDTSNPPLILLGSSTWPGEEQMLVEVLEEALQKGINCRLLIVPRHAERRDEIMELLSKQNRAWHMRTQGKVKSPLRIYIADTTGELALLSQIADVAFIGKSLLPNNGGQTPIEAALLGLPIVYGPNMTNFKAVCKTLEKSEAAIKADDDTHVKKTILSLLKSTKVRNKMADAAKNWHERNCGATNRTYSVILELLKGKH